MKLFFYRMDDYNSLDQARTAGALRELYLEDAADPSLSKGAAADAVQAVLMAVDMMDGNAKVQFVLATDDDQQIEALPPDPTDSPAFNAASEWCIKHLGCDTFDLGWTDDVVRAIERGDDTIEECRHLADKYDLTYLTPRALP